MKYSKGWKLVTKGFGKQRRKVAVNLKISGDEKRSLDDLAEQVGLSRTECIVFLVANASVRELKKLLKR